LDQGLRLAALALQRDADEDSRALRRRVAVVELGDAARSERLAEAQELALPFRDLDRDQRLAVLAELGPLGDVHQPIEVHVRAARDRDVVLALTALLALQPALQARDGERAGRLHDDAAVLENVLDRGADLVRLDEHDLVDDLAGHGEGVIADAPDGDAVREDADVLERDRRTVHERVVHARRVDGLDADDRDVRIELLDIRADAADEPAAADRHEDRRGRGLPLPRQLDADRPLSRDHVGIAERVDEHELFALGELQRVLVRLVIGVAVQDDLAAERAYRVDLDRRRARRHDDHGAHAAAARRERDALGVVAGGAADHALRDRAGVELRDLVVRAAQLERENRLLVLALQPDLVAEAP